ncbi:MAG TPA: class I SAM-dependent methyltransferase [bacterium]|nr:class I SAM-dependent methyltransferase [bacterium]
MGLDTWIVDHYVDGTLPVPGLAMQFVLHAYLDIWLRLEALVGRATDAPQATEEIAARSRELMEVHYNLPLPMFSSFLGNSMKYSMGLWETGARTLDEAQEAMLADVCAKAEIQDGQRILDIGCGFGSFAAHVLRHYPNAHVCGLTLSRTQANYMRERQAEAGHPLSTNRFSLVEGDFNDASFEESFDRMVSLGVFEHISNLDRALEKIRGFLTPEGRCFLHYIAFQPRGSDTDAPRQDPFMDRYVFPGGRVWAMSELAKHQQHFHIEREWYLSGTNYKRTLQAWLANFQRNQGHIREDSGLSMRQLRLWEFYLRACIATFALRGGRHIGNGQYLLRPI